jgi:hypothetical protein
MFYDLVRSSVAVIHATKYVIFLLIDTVYFLPNHLRGRVPYLQKDCLWKYTYNLINNISKH